MSKAEPKTINLPADRQFELDGKKVVGIRLSSYKGNEARAAQVVFSDGTMQAISVNVEKHWVLLEGDEFYARKTAVLQHLLDKGILKVGSNISPRIVLAEQEKASLVKLADDISGL
jgi:hypothetical protein